MTRYVGIGAVLIATAVAIFPQSGNFIPRVNAQTLDPCAAIPASAGTASTSAARPAQPKTSPLDHDDRWSHLDSLWAHRTAVANRRASPRVSSPAATQDVGELSVLFDTGDLVIEPNTLDLADAGLRLLPNAAGGYDVEHIAYGFRQPLGAALTMADDDAREVALPFGFRFFGQSYDRVFVNSDGNLTFGGGDVSTSSRSVSRLLTGLPRVAPFLADLDPSAAGQIVTAGTDGAFNVTWCAVPEFGSRRTATVQVSLLSDGTIEMQFSARTTSRDAVIGVSPGNTTSFTPVNLSADGRIEGGSSAVGERFTSDSDLDTAAVGQRFLATHADAFDNIVVFTDFPLLTDAFAYEISVSNHIQGLNLPIFDNAAEYGSRGQLQSICNMDALSKYPDNPLEPFLGENSTVSVLGQEVGHRWLAYLKFRDGAGQTSDALLGRDASHWSFFFDSDGSVLEGNDIRDLGNGSFRTVGAVERYSLLDQYAMGLVDQTQVPPFFYVQNPRNVVPFRRSTSDPDVGVTFNGTRRDVRIEDVIAAAGPRVPSAAESPRVYRQAFVYVVSVGHALDPAVLVKLDRIRVAWDQFFSAATDSRMRAETRISVSNPASVDSRSVVR